MTSAGSNMARVPSPCTARTCGACAKFALARAASSASNSIAVTLEPSRGGCDGGGDFGIDGPKAASDTQPTRMV
jgi:hypothetical protein